MATHVKSRLIKTIPFDNEVAKVLALNSKTKMNSKNKYFVVATKDGQILYFNLADVLKDDFPRPIRYNCLKYG